MRQRASTDTVADAVAEAAAARGIRHVFGLPGGETIPLIEAFRRRDIAFVLGKHGEYAGAEVVRAGPGRGAAAPAPAPVPDPADIERLIHRISAARQPVIMARAGVVRNDAAPALTRLARHRRIPVAVTMKAKGAFPETDRLFLGAVGFTTHQERRIGQVFRDGDLALLIGYGLNKD